MVKDFIGLRYISGDVLHQYLCARSAFIFQGKIPALFIVFDCCGFIWD